MLSLENCTNRQIQEIITYRLKVLIDTNFARNDVVGGWILSVFQVAIIDNLLDGLKVPREIKSSTEFREYLNFFSSLKVKENTVRMKSLHKEAYDFLNKKFPFLVKKDDANEG